MRNRIKLKEASVSAIETLKSSGVKCSRQELWKQGVRFYNENKDILDEARTERAVLKLKYFYKRKGWNFPPRVANRTTAEMINGYYGQKLVEIV